MFIKSPIVFDEPPESGQTLVTAIHLAKSLDAELRAVSVRENLPPCAGYIDARAPGETILLRQQVFAYYPDLQVRGQQAAQREGGILTSELVEGDEVQAIVERVQRPQSDLLVLDLPKHSLLLSHLRNRTTHVLAFSRQLNSSILGVH
jgi:hypothetical protein